MNEETKIINREWKSEENVNCYSKPQRKFKSNSGLNLNIEYESDLDSEEDSTQEQDSAQEQDSTQEQDSILQSNLFSLNEEKTFPKLINTFFIYISKKNVILSVIKKLIPTVINEKENICFISKEKILKYIQQNKIIIRNKNKKGLTISHHSPLDEKNKTLKNKIIKYYINDLVLYIGDKDCDNIVKSISFINDIFINPTTEYLHPLNSLYFLMKEV